MLGALGLFAAVPAQAQTTVQTTVWSATLTTKDLGSGRFGCTGAGPTSCGLTSVLTDDDFTHDGVTYRIAAVEVATTGGFAGDLVVELNRSIPSSLQSTLTMHVGSSQFAVSDAELLRSNRQAAWSNSGLTWTAGGTVSLKLTVSTPATGVWSATLTTKDLGSGRFGCTGAGPTSCGLTSVLTDDDFTHDGVTYRIVAVEVATTGGFAGDLVVELNRSIPSSLQSTLTMHVGSSQFAVSDAELLRSNRQAAWSNSGLTWTAGGTVSLKLTVSAASTDPPAAPTNLGVTPGDTKLDLSWTAPAGTVTGYDVHYTSAAAGTVANNAAVGNNAATAWVDASHSGTTASHTISSLTNDTPYRVRVRAKNATGNSGWLHGTGTPQGAPTVSLSASPNPVGEGSMVSIFARLSRALSSDVVIPVTLTDNTAESTDHETLSSIYIFAGFTTGGARVRTAHDSDEDDETFTVALDTANLPSSVTAGSPSSVQIRIADDEGAVRVSLRASPNPVREGAPVVLEVGLTRGGEAYLPSGTLRIPVKVTRPPSGFQTERGDLCRVHEESFSVDVHISGRSFGVRNLLTCHDADRDDEIFTVALDADRLSAGYLLSTSRSTSAQITITDDEGDGGPPGGRTVTLLATPNPVREGGTVTVTATLEFSDGQTVLPTNLQHTVTIPLRVYGMTSEPGDHGTLSSITIPRYRSSATATIATVRDGDGDDETFAVQLGRLPAHIGPGRCASLRVTIAEGGGALRDDPYACGGGSGGGSADARLRRLNIQR